MTPHYSELVDVSRPLLAWVEAFRIAREVVAADA